MFVCAELCFYNAPVDLVLEGASSEASGGGGININIYYINIISI